MTTLAPLSSVTVGVVEDIQTLMHELSTSPNAPVTTESVQEIIDDKNAFLVAAKDEGRIVGMATLYILPKATKRIGLIEDVVVLNAYRGQGLGEELMHALIKEGKKRELASISLTSRRSRVAAHGLYGKLGFQKPETDYFRLSF